MQKLQLTIPEPCHQNWQHMHPTEQGRFCNACTKEVIDFSMMTDMEILNYFTTLTHENICGRALPDQLNRTISQPKEPKKRLFWYWNYIVMFFMFFGKANTVKAQGGVKRVTEVNLIKPIDISNGLVCKTGEVAGAQVRSKAAAKPGYETKVRLGQVGFTMIAGALYVVDGTILPGGTDIHPDDVDNIIILHGPEAIALFGPDGSEGAIVITTRKIKVKNLDTVAVSIVNNSLSGRLGGVRVRSTYVGYSEVKTRLKTILTDSLKIYPNPVQRGDQINISLKLKQTGSHNFQITDATGRILLQKQINPVAKECSEKIQTDNRWGSGVYYLRIFDINNKLVSKNNFMIK